MNKIEEMPMNLKLVLLSSFFMFVALASVWFSLMLNVTITQKILNVIVAFWLVSIVSGIMAITLTILKHSKKNKKGE